MYPELAGKVIVISGAGGALGRAVVKRFQAEDARLALIDIKLEPLQAVSDALGLSAEQSRLGAVDLTQPDAVNTFLDQIMDAWGRVDVVVNVAGGFRFSGPVQDANPEDLDAMVQMNVKTAYTLSAAGAKRMVAAGTPGRIINIGARAALAGQAGMAAYTASKAAVLRITESMAAELRDQNITVNAILPSTIDTPANRKSMPNADFTKWVAPESLADVIAFLASDSSRDISGAAIPVYGKA